MMLQKRTTLNKFLHNSGLINFLDNTANQSSKFRTQSRNK